MTKYRGGSVLQHVRTLFSVGTLDGLTDGQLLERFTNRGDEAAELAFAALVQRHGPMVFRVCRRVLSDQHDAHDAFQATFLVLVKKAGSIRSRDSCASWLHGVALRTARCARAADARRKRHERGAARWVERDVVEQDRDDPGPVLHEELERIPEHFRAPILLCDLEGLTYEQAARHLGWPVGTVKSRLARGRDRLRNGLMRRGLVLSSGVLGIGRAPGAASAATVAAWADSTVEAVKGVMAGPFPAAIDSLMKEVLKTMLINRLRTAAATVCAITLLAAGLGTIAPVAAEDSKPTATKPRTHVASLSTQGQGDPPRALTLREAIRIGLGHSRAFRVIGSDLGESLDGELKIVPVAPDVETQGLKTRVMAEIRAIERQYWDLAQQQAQIVAAEKAAEFAQEVAKREDAMRNAGLGSEPALAESRRRYERARLNLASKVSDLNNSETGLRRLIGLPAGEGRRIVLASIPREDRGSLNWEECVATMLEKHPEIVRTRARVKQAEDKDAAAKSDRAPLPPVRSRAGQEVPTPPPGEVRDGSTRLELERQRSFLDQVIHHTTHSLARYFLEIDVNHKRYRAAKEDRISAAEDLEAKRVSYEEGRIAADPYLDAVGRYASAVAEEAQSRSSFNISLLELEEARGTLLDRERITVEESSLIGQ